MRNQHKYRGARKYLGVLEFRTHGYVTELITVHTFGGRGSPSF